MLTSLQMILETEEDQRVSAKMSSILHGVLMQSIDSEYAEELHREGWKPYSQFLTFREGKACWTVQTVTERAYQHIIQTLLSPEFQGFYIEKHEMSVRVTEKKLVQLSRKTLTQDFYGKDSDRFFRIRFITPTAFKQKGAYTFYPDIRCIYQSLMNKYDAASEAERFSDEEVLEQLTRDTAIIRYNLKSTYFSLEGVRIPSFLGEVVIKVGGTQTMVNLVHLLLRFGEYSGVGIKTGIGMGAIELAEGRSEK